MIDTVTLDLVPEEPARLDDDAEALYCQSYVSCLFHITIGPW